MECSLKGEHTKTVQLPGQRDAACTRVVTVEPERSWGTGGLFGGQVYM